MNVKEAIVRLLNDPIVAKHFARDYANYPRLQPQAGVSLKTQVMRACPAYEIDFACWLDAYCDDFGIDVDTPAMEDEGIYQARVCTIANRVYWAEIDEHHRGKIRATIEEAERDARVMHMDEPEDWDEVVDLIYELSSEGHVYVPDGDMPGRAVHRERGAIRPAYVY